MPDSATPRPPQRNPEQPERTARSGSLETGSTRDWAREVERLSSLRLAPPKEARDRRRALAASRGSVARVDRERHVAGRGRAELTLGRIQGRGPAGALHRAAAPGAPATVRHAGTFQPAACFGDLWRDLRYAWRSLAAAPGFAIVAVLSLALGIGANTAIFSLWNGLLHASLPLVQNPEQLVMLSSPDDSGSWTGRVDGIRKWLTYEEFEQLRDHAEGFSGMMASQSSLDAWEVRIDDGVPEEATGRLVSGGFFEVLGVGAAMGRVFTTADDRTAAPVAIVSHSFWQRRFGGRSDVLGKTIVVRKAALTIIGVAPRGFIGETYGQQPDVWFPLRMQPSRAAWQRSAARYASRKVDVASRVRKARTPGVTTGSSRVPGERDLSGRLGIVLWSRCVRRPAARTPGSAAAGPAGSSRRLADTPEVLAIADGAARGGRRAAADCVCESGQSAPRARDRAQSGDFPPPVVGGEPRTSRPTTRDGECGPCRDRRCGCNRRRIHAAQRTRRSAGAGRARFSHGVRSRSPPAQSSSCWRRLRRRCCSACSRPARSRRLRSEPASWNRAGAPSGVWVSSAPAGFS